MESPKCPYCSSPQYLTIEDHSELGRMVYYLCIHCGSRSPAKTTIEEAYAAAMKREKKRKTYAEDFKQKFPNARTIDDGVPHLCRMIVYGGNMSNCDRTSCAACWNVEMEDEDESMR